MRQHIRQVGRHGLIYTISTFAGSAMGFILIPLLTAWLTPAQYGIIANVQSIVNLFNVLFAFGMTVTWMRYWYIYEDNSRDHSRFLGVTLMFVLVWSITIIGLMLLVGPGLFAKLLPGVDFYPFVLAALLTSLCMVVFNLQQIVFRIRNQSLLFAAFNIGRLVLTVALVVVGVHVLHRGALGKVGADLVVAALGAILAGALLLKRVKPCLDMPKLKEALRYSLPVLPHTLAVAVLQLTDKFFLTNMRGLDDTGVYSIAFKFGGIMSIIVYSTNLAWQPFFMKNAEQKGEDAPPLFARLTTYWLMAMMLAALGITFFSSEAIQLFTFSAPFRAAAPLTPIFVFAYLAHGMYMLAALQVFYDKRAVRIIPLATVTAGLTNIGLNALLIPHWGMYGAAWATFISHFVNLTFALIVAQRHYFIPYEWKRILALFGMTGLAVAAYYALHLLGLGVWSAAAAKLAIIAVWLLALLVTGFLSPSERANMLDMTRQILKARKQSNR